MKQIIKPKLYLFIIFSFLMLIISDMTAKTIVKNSKTTNIYMGKLRLTLINRARHAFPVETAFGFNSPGLFWVQYLGWLRMYSGVGVPSSVSQEFLVFPKDKFVLQVRVPVEENGNKVTFASVDHSLSRITIKTGEDISNLTREETEKALDLVKGHISCNLDYSIAKHYSPPIKLEHEVPKITVNLRSVGGNYHLDVDLACTIISDQESEQDRIWKNV